jgi:hypothetical protein
VHTRVTDIELDGFVMTSAAPGENVEVQVKDWATSDSPFFYIYAEQIANIIFPKLGILNFRDFVNRYLVVIHPDNTADVYGDDFAMTAKIRPTRSLSAREIIYVRDIGDIAEVRFPEIQIERNDKMIFLERSGWRFGIFFDFTKQVDLEILATDIAKLHKRLILEDVLKNTLAEFQSKEAQADLVTEGQPRNVYEAFVVAEGKTDWKHLEKAFEKLGYKRKLEFSKPDADLGDMGLLEICRRAIFLPPHDIPVICIFDRDNDKVRKALVKQSGGLETEYQSWGNNVYSLMLPHPENRKAYQNISIEMYYHDETIRRTTNEGKRLFFDNELRLEIPPGGKMKYVVTAAAPEIELNKKVYSGEVDNIEDDSGRKVGVSKTVFAELIHTEQEPFKAVDFENFRYVSNVLEKILSA